MSGGPKLLHVLLFMAALFLMWLPDSVMQSFASPFMSEEKKKDIALGDFAATLGEGCALYDKCDSLFQISCGHDVAGGKVYFYHAETFEKVSVCSSDCPKGACEDTLCPPAEWSCPVDGLPEPPIELKGEALPEPTDELSGKPIYTPDASAPVPPAEPAPVPAPVRPE